MLGFLPTVLAVTVFGRIILLSIPKNGSIYRYLSVAVVLCVSAVVILPVAELVVSLDKVLDIDFGDLTAPEYGGYESIFEEGIADSLYPSVEEYVYGVLESEFSVMRSDCDVTVEFNSRGDVIAIERITVFLKNNARFVDTGKICRYFEESLKCIVDVSVDLP
jgi:hypothetical protein